MSVVSVSAGFFLLLAVFVRWQVIDYSAMPYPTVGDWRWKGAILHVYSARLSRRRYELLILVHETVEAIGCAMAGISEQSVTKFDLDFEAGRIEGDTSEPGDDPHAPYRRQHGIATLIERGLARLLGVDWADYEREVEAL